MSEKEFNEICNLDNLADEAGGFVDVNSVSEKHPVLVYKDTPNHILFDLANLILCYCTDNLPVGFYRKNDSKRPLHHS